MQTFEQVDVVARVGVLLDQMYGGFLGGDRGEIDRLLSPTLTMFDSHSPDLVDGMAELNALRDGRTASTGPKYALTAMTVLQLHAREVAGAVVASWWLRIDANDEAGSPVTPEYCRMSAVLVGTKPGLAIEHLQEEVWQPLGGPAAARVPNLDTVSE